jgi:hypothetical protein
MKTGKLFLVIMLAVLSAGTVMATGNLRMNISSGEKDEAVVEISNLKTSVFQIDVKDENGEVIFYKKTKVPSTNYKRVYDFSRLDDGTYSMTVKIDRELTEKRFDIRNGQVNVLAEKKVVEPFFVHDNQQFKMSYLNFSGDDVKLFVYDNNRNEIYKKDFSSDFTIHHGLDLSKLPRGNYEFVLSSGNEIFDYKIRL